MARAFIKRLPDGTRRGNTRGLRQCERDGWLILAGARYAVRYAPRTLNDCRPWTDGLTRFWSRDCWAVPHHRAQQNPLAPSGTDPGGALSALPQNRQFRVSGDPEGNEFCVLRGAAERAATG